MTSVSGPLLTSKMPCIRGLKLQIPNPNPKPQTPIPKPQTTDSSPQTPNPSPTPQTLYSQPSTPNPQLYTRNPKSSSRWDVKNNCPDSKSKLAALKTGTISPHPTVLPLNPSGLWGCNLVKDDRSVKSLRSSYTGLYPQSPEG